MRNGKAKNIAMEGTFQGIGRLLRQNISNGGLRVGDLAISTGIKQRTLRRVADPDNTAMDGANLIRLVQGTPTDLSLAIQGYVSGCEYTHYPRIAVDPDLNGDGVVDALDAYKAQANVTVEEANLFNTIHNAVIDGEVDKDELIEITKQFQKKRAAERQAMEVPLAIHGNTPHRKKARTL